MPDPIEVIIKVEPKVIEEFHHDSQEGHDWGNINAPFDSNNLSENVGTTVGSWYQQLEAGQQMNFSLMHADPAYGLEIVYISLNPLGVIDYKQNSPIDAWKQVLDLEKTQGAIGGFGAFYLTDPEPNSNLPLYSLVASNNLKENSPNLSYTILFSFIGIRSGRRHYCTIDPLIKTSSVHTPPNK